jgi:hypothetical protein
LLDLIKNKFCEYNTSYLLEQGNNKIPFDFLLYPDLNWKPIKAKQGDITYYFSSIICKFDFETSLDRLFFPLV